MKNTSKISVLVGICMVVCIAGCGGEDRQKAKLVNDRINIIDEQMEGLDKGHAELTARTDNLEDLVEQMKAELDQSAPAIQVATNANTRMRELYFGTESKEGLSDFSPSTWNSTTLLIVAIMVLGLWLLWRMREQKQEMAMDREIDQVVNRLSHNTGGPSSSSAATITTGAPAETGPATPAPQPEKETTPQPETPGPEEDKAKADDFSPTTGAVESGTAETPDETPSEESLTETEPAEAKGPGPEATQEESVEKEEDVTAGPAEEKTESEQEKKAKEAVDAEEIKEEKRSAPKPAKKTAKKTSRKKTEKKTGKRPERTPAKKCKVKGCNNKHRSKGLCNRHYQQWRRGTLEEDIEE